MNPLVLELVCRELRMTDEAVVDLKRQLRLARNNQAKLRRENGHLRVQVFGYARELKAVTQELGNYLIAAQAIASALTMLPSLNRNG